MWVYLTWLVLDIMMAGVGLPNMVGVRYYHVLMRVYLICFVLDNITAGVGLSNMVGVIYYHG